MDGMLQNMRDQRASVDTGTGEKRLAKGRESHTGRGTFQNWQSDLGFSSTEAEAELIRADEKTFRENVAEQQGKLDAAEVELSGIEKGLTEDIIPVKYYHSDGTVSTYNLHKDTAKKYYESPDVFAIYGQDVDEVYVPGKKDQQRYAYGEGPLNTAGQRWEYVQTGVSPTYGEADQGGKPVMGWRKVGEAGDYKQNVLHLRGGSSKYSHEFAKSLDAAQQQTDAALKPARESVATSRTELEGARGLLKGQVDLRDEEWANVRSDYADRARTMREILGGLNFG